MRELEACLSSLQSVHERRRSTQVLFEDIELVESLLAQMPDIMRRLETQNDVCEPGFLHLHDLAFWLIGRTASVGAEQASRELSAHLAEERSPDRQVMLLDGLSFESSDEVVTFEFSNSIRLAAWEAFSEFSIGEENPFPLNVVLYADNGQVGFNGACLDICRCLSLVRGRNCAVQPLYITVARRVDRPRPRGTNQSYFIRPRAEIAPSVLAFELYQADQLLKKLASVRSDRGDHLRMVLDRWCDAGSRISGVDTAISLRICMESLLTAKNERGIAQKTSTRGALLLGGGLQERKRAGALLKAAYRACSNAVHDGIISESDYEELEAAIPLIKRLIIKWLDAGWPSLTASEWQEIELGRDPEAVLRQ